MDTAELRQRLGDILREEERSNVDWLTVERMCEALGQGLNDQADVDCPHIVHHFLSDHDIRSKDADYGREQRVEIERFVETGECNDSKPVYFADPGRPVGYRALGCLTLLATTGALLILLFR